MIINFNDDSLLSWEDSINLSEELDKLDENGIIIKVDVFVATYINSQIGTHTSHFVNWDCSDVTDGVMDVYLRRSNNYKGAASMSMRCLDKWGDFEAIEFNLNPVSLRRIIEASNYNGKDPSDVSVIIDGIDGPIPTKNLLICANGKALAKE